MYYFITDTSPSPSPSTTFCWPCHRRFFFFHSLIYVCKLMYCITDSVAKPEREPDYKGLLLAIVMVTAHAVPIALAVPTPCAGICCT